jgi:hypothetical protein
MNEPFEWFVAEKCAEYQVIGLQYFNNTVINGSTLVVRREWMIYAINLMA